MRADRLVSILMLLQSRGRVPARELADLLGVSVRTIFRDMDALSAAGIPVYAERGSTGGCCLVEDYRTDLTGLNEEESRALFLLTVPGPLDHLEVGSKLKSALRKLAAALPDYLEPPERAQSRLVLDWTGWGHRPVSDEYLSLLYRAVQRQEQVRLSYQVWMGIEVEQEANPLGLAAKTGEWYLAWMAHGKVRWQRVSELLRVEPLGTLFSYPSGLDLDASWQNYCAEREAGMAQYSVRARASQWAIDNLHRRQGVTVSLPCCASRPEEGRASRPEEGCEPGLDGWVEVELAFSSFEAARQNLMGLGRGIKVLSPETLRLGIADMAAQILDLYQAS